MFPFLCLERRNQDKPQRTKKTEILVIPGRKVSSGSCGGIPGTPYILYNTCR